MAAQIKHELDPITTIEEIDGEEFSPHPLDSCDAGQLEACAIERFISHTMFHSFQCQLFCIHALKSAQGWQGLIFGLLTKCK